MATTFSLSIAGANLHRRFELLPGDVSRVGRGLESNILIQDPNISRHQLTLFVRDDHVDVELNPQSSNQLIKNDRPMRSLSLLPGEFFNLGPYRFELEVTADMPRVDLGGLPPDPAGPIDVKLAAEMKRIAPRWSTVQSASPAPAAAPTAPGETLLKRVLLPVAATIVACLVAWEYLGDTPTAVPPTPSLPAANIDLLASVQPPTCHTNQACRNQAHEANALGEKLRESGSKDLITLYRIAKQFHRARLMLAEHDELIPQLRANDRQARTELLTAFTDIKFRFERARAEGDLNRQLAALQAILALCGEDRLSICTNMERIQKQLQEYQLMMR